MVFKQRISRLEIGKVMTCKIHFDWKLITSLKIMYTNVDKTVSKQVEIEDCLRKAKPDVVCMMGTKLETTFTWIMWAAKDTMCREKTERTRKEEY